MLRTLAAVVVLVAAGPATGSQVVKRELPELVGRADVIVVGDATAVRDPGSRRPSSYTVEVTAVLLGDAPKVLSLPASRHVSLGPNPGILFLVARKTGLSLDYPIASPADRADEVRRLVKLKADLKAAAADPKTALEPDFLTLLGHSTAGKDAVGGVSRADAVAHLRRGLAHADEAVALAAVRTLWATGDRSSAAAAVPLLKRAERGLRWMAASYLEQAGDRVAVGPLCDTLDALANDTTLPAEDRDNFLWLVAEALGRIGDPIAAPALERGVRAGHKLGRALGRVGDEQHVQLLLDRIDAEPTSSIDGLLNLITRSNVTVEMWMRLPGFKGELEERWRAWWAENRAGFKVVRTAAEVDRGGPLGGPGKAPEPRPKNP